MQHEQATLERGVQAYLAALVERNPDRLPLAPRVRFTENGQPIALGDGLWGSVTPDPPLRRALSMADVERGQAGFLGAVAEHGEECLLGVRLAFDDEEQLTEIEQLVCRPHHSLFDLFDPTGMSRSRAHLREVVPEASRVGRDTLVAVANAYFDGIEASDGSRIPVTDSCVRFENGVQSVRKPAVEGGFGGGHMQVAEQISSGMFRYIGAIRDRRFPVVDEQRGLVLAIGFFDHPGKRTSVEVARIGEVALPPFATRPSSALIFEVFKVVDGEIVAIEALLDFFPYGMRAGW